MKDSILVYVGWLLIVTAFGFFLYGIGYAIYLSWGAGPVRGDYSDVLSTTIGSIEAILLTNLGALLGISVVKPDSAIARRMKLDRPTTTSLTESSIPPLAMKESIQLAAAVVFILSLVACMVTWAVEGFDSKPENIVSVIPASGKMFIGVVLAYLTAVLR